MTPREQVPLAPYTTFGIGGSAELFFEAKSEEDIQTALALSRERGLPLRVLGSGSNILVPDDGVRAFVVKLATRGITLADGLLTAEAGARWDDVVDCAASHGLWGIENLAGIPGTVGGAVVQNIGAYGAALSETFSYADALDTTTGEARRFTREDCRFGYRDSVFKHEPRFVIVRAAFALSRERTAGANLSYRDPARRYKDLAGLLRDHPDPSPAEVAAAIRAIRADKFPDVSREGTAGSFFANPVLPRAAAEALAERFRGMPLFALPETTDLKVPAGWLLDNVLHLRGHAHGSARVYEKHSLVIVAGPGASSHDVDALANDIAARVKDATGITLLREVETFGA